MRIVFAGHSLATPIGGGELSAESLLTALAQRHEVEAVCAGREALDYMLGGAVRCRDHPVVRDRRPVVPFSVAMLRLEARFRPVLGAHVRVRPPDLLLLQQPACLDPADVPDTTKVVVFVRSLACYGAMDPDPNHLRRALGRPMQALRLRRNRPLLDRADLIVSNSQFVQAALRDHAGIDSEVVPPFVDTAALRSSRPRRPPTHLTFVGLDPWKGASIAIKLAEALPERSFLFLEGARSSPALCEHARRLPNVTVLGWTRDMADVFAGTRVLLMPSVWAEPFGRLPVEAGACGVPTIASARGGLAESVGGGGVLVDPVEDLAGWVAAICALDDPGVYESLAATARAHAASFDLDVTLLRLSNLLRGRLGVDLGVSGHDPTPPANAGP